MADSIATISAQLRLEYPFPQQVSEGNSQRDMIQAEYDQWIADQAVRIRDQQLADEVDAARKELRRKIRRGLPRLRDNLTTLRDTPAFNALSALQKAEVLRRTGGDTTQGLIELIEGLITLTIFEDDA